MSLTYLLLPEFSCLPHLNTLDLSYNYLSGSPPSLANLKALQVLHLDHNRFTKISTSFFQDLPQTLGRFSLSNNPFLASWTIPGELAKFERLTEFNASNANVTGKLPNVFGSVPVMKLDISYNTLTGSLSATFKTSKIRELPLQYQKVGLSDPIHVWSSRTFLNLVSLQGNNLTDPIPDLSNSMLLDVLYLDQNQFNGLVPQSWANISGFSSVISLSKNKLQGPYPIFLRNDFASVSLDGNNFCTNESSFEL
ncbi:hypothetical protein SLE2022_391570 [Rubroshorea leprosula]